MVLCSATEWAAILDVCRSLHLPEEATLGPCRDLLLRIGRFVPERTRIVSMLTRMSKPRESGTGTGTSTET